MKFDLEVLWISLKVSRIQKVSHKNQNKFQNKSGGKIQRSLQFTKVDTYVEIQAANKYMDKKIFVIKTTSPTNLISGGKTITLIVHDLPLRYLDLAYVS